MKYITTCIILAAILMPQSALAFEGYEYELDIDIIFSEQAEMSGADRLLDSIEDDVRQRLADNGIDSINPDVIAEFNLITFMSNTWDMIKTQFTAPFALFLTITGIMLLCAMLGALKSGEENAMGGAYSIITGLAVCAVTLAPVVKVIGDAADSIRQAGDFMLSFIPVYVSVVTAAGRPTTAAAYSAVLFTATQGMMSIVSGTLVPLLGVFAAISAAGSAGGKIKLDSAAGMIKKVVLWSLGLLLTLFIGILSIQTMVTNSADTVVVKTAKFMVSSFIPVVGGPVSEALNTVIGCLAMLKTTVAGIGIIVCLFTLLPTIISLVLYMTALHAASAAGDILGIERIPGILKSAADTMSIMLGAVVFAAVLITVSTTVIAR